MTVVSRPTLTIGIPTFQRADFLSLNLNQIKIQIENVPIGSVEVIVSDNCSLDHTGEVVKSLSSSKMPIRYIRNKENVGWAKNFIQVFEEAKGEYILMMGDDDLLVDGTLALIIEILNSGELGVVCLKPYGYDSDFKKERPNSSIKICKFKDPQKFIIATHKCFTLTSALVLNKNLLRMVDSREFLNTDLATFHLMIRAALNGSTNVFVKGYLIASKRHNSFPYEYVEVFVNQFWRIIDSQIKYGLLPETIKSLENRRLWAYYPFYMYSRRISDDENLSIVRKSMLRRFKGNYIYHIWVDPILIFPRYLALAWGGIAVVVGRLFSGDAGRGIKFLSSLLWLNLKRVF